MNIKSLLLGSAAALAVVSGAQAADAIVAAEPEPMEYVRVCDAFGTGYFYIPGTETCLQIGGFARFQIDFGEDTYATDTDGDDTNDYFHDYDFKAVGVVTFDAKSDTELGTLQGFLAIEADISEDGADAFYMDEAYLALGGLKAGYFYGYWDASIAGEVDDLKSNTRFVSIGYEYSGDAFSAGLFIDEFDVSEVTGNHGIGVEAQVKGSFGPVTVALLGGYDTDVEEGAIRAILTAGVGPGTFNLGGFYSTDPNQYGNEWEWAIASSYAFKATDKLTITPGIQYSANKVDGTGLAWGSVDMWSYGVMIDYKPVENLLVRLNLDYDDRSDRDGVFGGYFRLQRSF